MTVPFDTEGEFILEEKIREQADGNIQILVDEEKIFSEAEKRLGEEGKIRLQEGSYVIKVSV